MDSSSNRRRSNSRRWGRRMGPHPMATGRGGGWQEGSRMGGGGDPDDEVKQEQVLPSSSSLSAEEYCKSGHFQPLGNIHSLPSIRTASPPSNRSVPRKNGKKMKNTADHDQSALGIGTPVKMPDFNRAPLFGEQYSASTLCFCNFGSPICELENACIKHHKAACFHAVKQEFNAELGLPEAEHIFGCAPLERGSDASHLTCNSWRSSHARPQTIACCYEGNFCNRALAVPELLPRLGQQRHGSGGKLPMPISQKHHQSSPLEAAGFLAFGFLIGLCLVLAIALPIRYYRRRGKRQKGLLERKLSSGDENGGGGGDSLSPLMDAEDMNKHFLLENSGSGSGGVTLNQRTIAMDLEMLDIFARGRYGELRKAVYRGTLVAVKIFHTTEEESWRNERDIYLSQMLNHENILQYVAADIMSSVESLTQMMLITDYHPLGSLYDYLRGDFPLSFGEALELAFTSISGLEHLHNPVRGTGGQCKPEIVHRDIKSKNVLVKRPGVCCLADFGLAIRLEAGGQCVPQKVNVQVGTKRYMAPELLASTLNVNNFEEFKWADMFSFSLVLWELLNCVEQPSMPATNATGPVESAIQAGQSQKGRGHQRLMSHSNSSGFASASDPTTYPLGSSSLASPPFAGLMNRFGPHQQKNVQSTANSSALCAGSSGTIATTTDSACSTAGREESRLGRGKLATATVQGDGKRQKQQRRRAHALPFQGIVDTDPSFEQMREIVCQKKIRPPIDSDWTGNMKLLAELMAECWREQAPSRHTALKVKKELAKLRVQLQAQDGQEYS